MRIDGLTLDFFRNYLHLEARFDPAVNVIYGENAQGKTNLLEAVAYLSGVSYRARYDRELIRFGVDRAFLKGEVFSRDREFLLEARLHRGSRRFRLLLGPVDLYVFIRLLNAETGVIIIHLPTPLCVPDPD